ncbi:hypothetical protein [Streptomyces sp. enrichment culture]|uniref:hypothetical protein n=1 Tax=Streptomyces sp. enrichment culture TaxID=1795815 RepID=UPI003F574E46
MKRSVAGTRNGLVRVGARAAATLLAGGLLTLAGQGIAQAAENGPASGRATTQAPAGTAGSAGLPGEVAEGAAGLARTVVDGLLNHDWGVPPAKDVPGNHDWGVPQPSAPDNHDWGVPPAKDVPGNHDWGVPQPVVPDNHDWGVPPVAPNPGR